ncbi:hypothetical protein imdm_931 [gamma proteobacterium IMCC2047]|nr:hypothetical protein imdm_931 [gamma proteobacterium IMCC2047]
MKTHTQNTLQEIGFQLDRNLFPSVYNGGIVKPSDTTVATSTLGEDINNDSQRQRRPETRSWQGASGWQRPTYRPWSPDRTAPLISSSLQTKYEAELAAVKVAYPNTTIWHQAGGMWLLTESSVLSGLEKKATFLTAIPYSLTSTVKSWGFWTTPVSTEWIGPRHTNFPDGSICAFEPKDKTWGSGDSVVKLLDLYSLWALRHEHLRVFGRWPGYQSVHHPYERLSELKDDEFCGCANSKTLYSNCCKKYDLARNQIADAIEFQLMFAGEKPRKPPQVITNFIHAREVVPFINALLS